MKLQLDPKSGKYKRFEDPTQLIGQAVLEASADKAPEGWLHHLVVDSVGHQNVQSDPKTKLKSVHATGTGVLKRHRLKDDAYFGGKPVSWEIQFKEGYDDIGVPDIELISFILKE